MQAIGCASARAWPNKILMGSRRSLMNKMRLIRPGVRAARRPTAADNAQSAEQPNSYEMFARKQKGNDSAAVSIAPRIDGENNALARQTTGDERSGTALKGPRTMGEDRNRNRNEIISDCAAQESALLQWLNGRAAE